MSKELPTRSRASAWERTVGRFASLPHACLAIALLALFAGSAAADERKVVIPFDFVSKFDDGVYGRQMGDMIWKKLEREGGFIIPDAMLDVRDFCESEDISPTPGTSLKDMREIIREDFDAQIGIWGSVERVPGHEWDVYDVVIRCVDFSTYPEATVVFECKERTKTVSEIPHVYVKRMLDALYQRTEQGPPLLDMLAERNWEKNPNLVIGDFQAGSGRVPRGWEAVGGQQREPLGRLVQWLRESGNPANSVIRFTFDKGVGDSTGVMYYSDWFPVEEGAKYRFQCRWRSNGPTGKVFIKCYAQQSSEYRTESAPPGSSQPGPNYRPDPGQRREVYRSQQNLKGQKNTWNVQREDFTPKHTKYTPRWGRVMLYAYLGGGVIEFDDVVIKQIVPASPSVQLKELRHSLETKVTIEEMKENERRTRQEK